MDAKSSVSEAQQRFPGCFCTFGDHCRDAMSQSTGHCNASCFGNSGEQATGALEARDVVSQSERVRVVVGSLEVGTSLSEAAVVAFSAVSHAATCNAGLCHASAASCRRLELGVSF